MKPDSQNFIGVEESELKDSSKIPVLNSFVTEQPKFRVFRPRINLQACTNSFNCIIYCPHDAIERTDKGRPQVNYSRCTGCLICLRECPTNAITEEREAR